jgi:penicillin-binding protein activator
MTAARAMALFAAFGCLSACVGCYTTDHPDNGGFPPKIVDPLKPGSGLGIESRELILMTNAMVDEMLADEELAKRTKAPRVIVDSELFTNRSHSRFDLNLITDRLRGELNRAAKGKMTFLAPHYADAVNKARAAKRAGETDSGTVGKTDLLPAGDYQLGGSIKNISAVDNDSGIETHYWQITFEMVNLDSDVLVWTGMYEFKKAAQDDLIYH